MKTLIIGYGSTLRRDDGVGYLVAEQLMETLGEDCVREGNPSRGLLLAFCIRAWRQ